MEQVIYILHLETSTKVCSVALSKNGEFVALKESIDEQYAHGEKLMGYIQDTLDQGGIKVADLHAISVASGPGSYTGLRIGVSTAKGICYGLNIPFIAVDSLTSMAIIAREKYPSAKLLPLIDARRMEVYSALFSENNYLIKPISADVIEASTYQEFEPFVVFGDGAEKLVSIWGHRQLTWDLALHPSAKGQIALAFEKYQQSLFENLAYFEPYYLKDFVTTIPKK